MLIYYKVIPNQLEKTKLKHTQWLWVMPQIFSFGSEKKKTNVELLFLALFKAPFLYHKCVTATDNVISEQQRELGRPS